MNATQEQLVMWSQKAQNLEAKLKTAQEWEDHYYQRSLAAEKERDYYRGQLVLVSDERDDITRLCAELEQRHDKAVEALRLLADPDNWLNVNYDIPGEAADLIWAGDIDPVLMLRDVLAAIKEPTDA